MLEIRKFKKSALGDSLGVILKHESNRVLWASVIVLSLGQSIYAQTQIVEAPHLNQDPLIIDEQNNKDDVDPDIEALKSIVNANDFDQQFNINAAQIQADLKAEQADLQQQAQALEVADVRSIMVDETLPELTTISVASTEEDLGADALAIEVEQVDAPKKKSFLRRILRPFSSDSEDFPTQKNIRVDVNVLEYANLSAADITALQENPEIAKLIKLKVDQGLTEVAAKTEIARGYNQSIRLLEQNIKNHLSTVKVDSLSQSASLTQQLRAQVNQAAEAVGFYETDIGRLGVNTQTGTVSVSIRPKYIAYFDSSSQIEVRGPNGETNSLGVTPNFSKIVEIFPDFKEGDFLNHGAFENMRTRINTAAEEDGHFEGYWTTTAITDTAAGLKDTADDDISEDWVEAPRWDDFEQAIAKVYDLEEPQSDSERRSRTNLLSTANSSNNAQLQLYPVQAKLIYEAGQRYKLGRVNFCTVADAQVLAQNATDSELYETDKSCPESSATLPIRAEILQNMVPWLLPQEMGTPLHKEITWKRSNDYAVWRINNLTSSLAGSRYFDNVEVIRKPDIYSLMSVAERKRKAEEDAKHEAQDDVTDLTNDLDLVAQTSDVTSTEESLEQLAPVKELVQLPEDKTIDVDVIISADKRNITDLGLGYGTDTGARLRAQYRRSIVNDRGHSFESNFELAEMRQSLDGRYLIPHNHSVYDYFSLVGGYEREERKGIFDDQGLLIESAVAGVDHVYTNPTGIWQHTIGLRYRLDRIDQNGVYDPDDKLDAFLRSGPEQQSLLFHLEASQSDSDDPVKPTSGFKQTYKVELGAEGVLTDANIAKVNAQWLMLRSFGGSQKHQLIGETELGYIFTDNFEKVPYNLRYFAGGDNSIRGFDYKSLSPVEDGIKIGGQALARASVEYNYEVRPNWRIAAFSDIGNAYDEKFTNSTAYGAGVGVRWASPVGPMRIDVASGLSDENNPIRLHFFIGTQF